MARTVMRKTAIPEPTGGARDRERSESASGPRSVKIRIAINAITELTPSNGARVYLLALIEELSKLQDIDLVVLVGKGQADALPPQLRSCSCEVSIPHRPSYWQVVLQHRIRQTLQQVRADVYHLPNTLPLLRKSVPTIVTIHDLAELRVRKYGLLRTLYRRWVNYFAAHRADRLLTVSENSKRDISELLDVVPARIEVVHDGVDRIFSVLDRASCMEHVRSRYAVRGEFILAPGGLSRNKNVDRLLLAFREVQQSGISHSLVLTGGGEDGQARSIVKLAKDLGVAGTVILTGRVPRAELPRLYNACSVVAYPSLYEGFGLPILESMACGAPLVTSATSSVAEVAGEAAILVDPYDPRAIATALRCLLTDQELRETLIRRGLERASRFTWRETALRTVQVYHSVAPRSASLVESGEPSSARTSPQTTGTQN